VVKNANQRSFKARRANDGGRIPRYYATDSLKMAANTDSGGSPVRKSRYSDEQITAALRQAEAGTPIAEITRKLGISEATFYTWRKRFGSLGTPEVRELRQLREENARLKRLVADLTLDRQVLQDVVKKKW
jgi:putative transposase